NVAFWTPEFVANRAFLTAAEDLEGFAAAADDAVEAAKPLPSTMEGMAAGADHALQQGLVKRMRDIADATDDAAEGVYRFRRALLDTVAAQRDLTNARNEALSPVAQAVGAIERMQEAQANLEAIEADSESTARDIAAAHWDYVESWWAAEAALQNIRPGQLITAIEGIAEALDISTDEAYDLLDALDLLDGKEVNSFVRVTHLGVGGAGSSAVPTGGFFGDANTRGAGSSAVPKGGFFGDANTRAAGGPVVGGGMYRVGEGNLPELLSTPSGLFMIPGDSGRVFSHMDSKALIDALAKGGGSVTINLYGTGDVRKDMGTVVSMAGLIGRVEATRR